MRYCTFLNCCGKIHSASISVSFSLKKNIIAMGSSKYKLTRHKKNGVNAYPKTLVEAVYWDKEKKSLGEVLEDIENSGGGSVLIECDANALYEIPAGGTDQMSKQAFCELLGIMESDLEQIFSNEDYLPALKAVVNEDTFEIFPLSSKSKSGSCKEIIWSGISMGESPTDMKSVWFEYDERHNMYMAITAGLNG